MFELLGFSDATAGAPPVWKSPGTPSSVQMALNTDGLALGVGHPGVADDSASRADDGQLFVVTDAVQSNPDVPTTPAAAVLAAYRSAEIAGLAAVPGNWSAAIVDRRHGHHDLVLARGGLGTHPLYLARVGSRLVFSSSIASLLVDGAVPRQVDAGALGDYLAGRAPRDAAATFLTAVRRVPAGHCLRVDWAVGGDRPLPSPASLGPVGGPPSSPRGQSPTDPGERPAALPTSTEFLTELPEAIRQLEQPLPDVAQYLSWRAARTTTGTAPDPVDGRWGPADEIAARWLRIGRAHVQGVFRSPGFCGRPYWDDLHPAESFRRACGRPSGSMAPFWRLLNAELWLRLFVDRGRDRLSLAPRTEELEELGDPSLRARIPAVKACPPHGGRHAAMIGRDRSAYLRLPVRTRHVWPGSELTDVVEGGLVGSGVSLGSGDVVVLAEKIVAISQGRVVPLEEVHVRPISRLLSRFTTRTPSGIFLGLPESFELAVREVGLPRILAGSAAAALTRPFGIRGVFYRFTGWQVAAIDSPDPDALPPSDTCVKLAPDDPGGVSARLAEHLSERAGARVEVAVVDVNDIGADVLGASPGVDRELLVSVLRDNPLGQDRQQTPVGIVRRVVPAGTE